MALTPKAATVLSRHPDAQLLTEQPNNVLEQSETSHVAQQEIHLPAHNNDAGQPGDANDEALDHRASRTVYHRNDLQLWSSFLVDYIVSNPHNYISALPADRDYLERSTMLSLQRWAAASGSRVLWICDHGSGSMEYPASNTFVSATIVNFAKTVKIPVLAFFCGWPWNCYEGRDLEEKTRKCQIDILSTLIRQAIDQLPLEFETTHDMSQKRFASLQGPGGWKKASLLFGELLQLCPRPMFIIMDGLDHLIASNECLECFNSTLKVLKSAIAGSMSTQNKENRAIKLLLTTSADSKPIQNTLEGLSPSLIEFKYTQTDALRKHQHLRLSEGAEVFSEIADSI